MNVQLFASEITLMIGIGLLMLPLVGFEFISLGLKTRRLHPIRYGVLCAIWFPLSIPLGFICSIIGIIFLLYGQIGLKSAIQRIKWKLSEHLKLVEYQIRNKKEIS